MIHDVLFSGFFSSSGLESVLTENGELVVEAFLKQGLFDLVLMDINM